MSPRMMRPLATAAATLVAAICLVIPWRGPSGARAGEAEAPSVPAHGCWPWAGR
jgi:hypothetical protein